MVGDSYKTQSRQASRPERVRDHNERLVLDLLISGGRQSRADLTKRIGLTAPAVSSIVAGLVNEGLVRETDAPRQGTPTSGKSGRAVRGRPPVMVEFVPDSRFAIGIRLGGVGTTLVITDALGRERARRTIPHFDDTTPENVIQQLAHGCRKLIETASIDSAKLARIGISLSARICPDTGTVLTSRRMGWENVDFAAALEQAVGAPVVLVDAGSASAIAEAAEGRARGRNNIVVVDVGIEVTATMIIEGRIVPGSTGLAGALGRCLVPGRPDISLPNKSVTSTQNKYLDDFVSIQSMFEKFQDGKATQNKAGASAQDMLDQAIDLDDPKAQTIIANAGIYLAHGSAWIVNLLNPERVVLTGAMGVIPQDYQNIMKDLMREYIAPDHLENLTIAFSDLGLDGWLRGAVLAALHDMTSDLDNLISPLLPRQMVR